MESGESDSPIVHIRGLEKSYGPNGVLRGIDLDAHANEVLTLFGPNGAGKTTLLRILATLTRPDAGTVRIDGRDVARAGVFTRQITGVALHSPMLYGHLTARENLLFHARMFRVPRQAERVAEVAGITQIEDRLDDQVRELSNGLQRRVSLARALLHRPRLLLLDEPETGLDQTALHLLDRVINEYRQDGRAVVMTTHSLERGLELGDRVGIMSAGRIAHYGPSSAVDPEVIRGMFPKMEQLERMDAFNS